MQQNMTEAELELLNQIQEDLDIAEQRYGCTMPRDELLTEVLERKADPVRPEDAERFFSGVLPSGWKNTYCREPKMLSGYLNALRKAISIRWCKEYVEPEIRALQRSDEDDHYYILPYFWLPEETLDLRVRRDHVPYDLWQRQGFLMTTEGNVVHYGFIENFIDELGTRFNIREIAFDRWGAVQMSQNLEGLGFTLVQFGQGYRDMSPPTKELMKLTLEQKIAHNGHPVLRWNMDNIFIKRDPAGNIKPDKEKSTEKIDGTVATIMALDRAIRCGNDSGDSIYDERDLLVL